LATAKRNDLAHLDAWLTREGRKLEFFPAVALLRKLRKSAAPIGGLGPIEAEPVHFSHDPSLQFHASDIASITMNGDAPAVLVSTFLGLLGTVTPLPMHMTEEVIGAEQSDEPALRVFYDIFHHRILSLFFRAWEKYRFESAHAEDASDPFSARMLAFAGVDSNAAGVDRRAALASLPLLPLMPGRTRPPHALVFALQTVLPGRTIDIEPFAFRSVRIADEERARLGRQSCTLGVDCSIGRAVADRAGRFRIVVRGATYADYEGMLRGGDLRERLVTVLDAYVGHAVEAEIDLRLAAGVTPPLCLGDRRVARLGLTTRLPRRDPRPLRARLVLDPLHGSRVRLEEEIATSANRASMPPSRAE
jgi:type VI secretion system protein ImpH